MKLTKYILFDLARNKFVIFYFILLLLFSGTFILLQNDEAKVQLSLLNIIILIVPLISIVFSTIHWYNSSEFIEVLLAQPISRKRIFFSELAALIISLGSAFILALGIPLFIFYPGQVSTLLVACGFALTVIFVALASLAAVYARDKARGIGISMMFWLYFSLIYDGLVLMMMFNLSDYPIEKMVVAMLSFNPVDIARVMVLMKMQMSAMLGYSGAVFTEFLGSSVGFSYSGILLAVWAAIPILLAFKKFSKKDL